MGKSKFELYIILLATAVLFFFAYTPVVLNFYKAPPDRFYYGQEEFALDMSGNLAYIRQGYLGNILPSFNYSTLIGSHPSILKIEYTLIGFIGRVLDIPPLPMFFISRFIISCIFLIVIYKIIRHIFSDATHRIVSYIFVLFGSRLSIPGYPYFITGNDEQVFVRLTLAMPHYMLGSLFIILALYFLSRTLEYPRKIISFVLSLIFGMLSSLIYAPDSMLLISGFPLYLLFDSISRYIRTRRVALDVRKIVLLVVYTVITLIPIVFVRWITLYGWDDVNAARMELLNPFQITLTKYVIVAGVLYFLSFIAIPSVIKKGKPLTLLLATWLVMHPFGEFIILPQLHLNYLRYFVTPHYIAFGILGTMGVLFIVRRVQGFFTILPQRLILITAVIVVLSTSVPTYKEVWDNTNICFCSESRLEFSYPKQSVMDGIIWLSKNTNPEDIVLSEFYAGTLIPAFSGNRVYVSWWYYLIQPRSIGDTETNLALFFSGVMSQDDAYKLMSRERIKYVFYSEPEQAFGRGLRGMNYPFLKERYNKNGTKIYQVQ